MSTMKLGPPIFKEPHLGRAAPARATIMLRSSRGSMERRNRNRGRPRKEGGRIEFWQFRRAAEAMCAYDEAREKGEKHSAAVRYAVDLLKQRHPERPISKTEVKRILAMWRPKESQAILRFERKSLTEEDVKKRRWIVEQLAILQRKEGLEVELPSNPGASPSTAPLIIRFGKRPNYPRHNRRIP
jgi:hypothetical protein